MKEQLAIVGYEDKGREGDLLISLWKLSNGAELLVEFKIPPRVNKFSRLMKARFRQDEKALQAYGFPRGSIEAFLTARENMTVQAIKEEMERRTAA